MIHSSKIKRQQQKVPETYTTQVVNVLDSMIYSLQPIPKIIPKFGRIKQKNEQLLTIRNEQLLTIPEEEKSTIQVIKTTPVTPVRTARKKKVRAMRASRSLFEI